MAYVNPRVRSFSQYLMTDDPPRALEAATATPASRAACARSKGKKKPAYKAFRLPLAVESYGASDVLWGLVRPYRKATTVTIEVDPPGKRGWRKLKTVKTTAHRRLRAARHPSQGQSYRVKWTLAERQAVRRRGRPRVLAPDHPSSLDGRPIGVQTRWTDNAASADLLDTMRTLRMHLLGIEVADATGTLARVGRRHLSLRRWRRARDGRAPDAALRRAPHAPDVASCGSTKGACVAPFSRHQIEDSPALSTGRHADEDPWRAKTYWYYEEPAVAVARA